MKKFLCILLLACVMITGCENKENASSDVKENMDIQRIVEVIDQVMEVLP